MAKCAAVKKTAKTAKPKGTKTKTTTKRPVKQKSLRAELSMLTKEMAALRRHLEKRRHGSAKNKDRKGDA